MWDKEKVERLLKELIHELDPNVEVDKIEDWGYDLSTAFYTENGLRFAIDCEFTRK